MLDLAVRTYALNADETGSDGLLPYLNADGAFIGPAVSLLEKDGGGRWRARPRSTLEALLSLGYGAIVDLEGRMGGLEAVARALNAGDRAYAAIALVHTRLPPLASVDHARRMAEADRSGAFELVKYDPSEPRVPAGDPAGGQWTGGGGAQSHRQKPNRPNRNDYKRVHGVPKDARVVRYPDGSVVRDERSGKTLLAPPNADFQKVYAAGEAIRGESLSDQYGTARTAIAQEGTFDFQRDPS